MDHIGAIILTGNILIGFLYLIFTFFVTKDDVNDIGHPKSYRIYWQKKDIFYCVFKLIIGFILFIGWLILIKFVDISITTKNQSLLNYLNLSAWLFICFGGYLPYFIYKHILKIIIGCIKYFGQKRLTVSNLLLKSINENDSEEVMKNTKLTLQSGNYQYLGSQEYTKLLNILIKNEEYIVANELVKKHFKFIENRGNPKLITPGRNSYLR